MRFFVLFTLASVLSGCVTINNSALSGEKNAVRTDADARQDISPQLKGNVPVQGGTVTDSGAQAQTKK